MKLYRFSLIKSKEELFEAINYIHVSDIDFYLEPESYTELKQSLLTGKKIKGARIFDRTDLDMIELYDPDIDPLAYVSTSKMTELVRIKRSEAIKL